MDAAQSSEINIARRFEALLYDFLKNSRALRPTPRGPSRPVAARRGSSRPVAAARIHPIDAYDLRKNRHCMYFVPQSEPCGWALYLV